MSKNKTVFVCSGCGYESLKWMGKCEGREVVSKVSADTRNPVRR